MKNYLPKKKMLEMIMNLAIIAVFGMYLVAVGYFAQVLFAHLHIGEKRNEVRCEVEQPYWY